jgi:DNA polymerase III subunit delta'
MTIDAVATELPWHADALGRELANLDRLPHAMLLHGPAGTGTGRFAAALAAALLCESPAPDGRACGRCGACGWVSAGTHPDLRLLSLLVDDDGKVARELKIEQVRALADFLVVGGHRGGRRVVVIDPADALNTVTANALLKTLEEPGDGLMFLLVSARPDALPATIRSRCQARALGAPVPAVASAWVQAQTGCTAPDAASWLAMSGGAPLDALAFAEPAQATAYRTLLDTLAGLPDASPELAADALQRVDARLWLPVLQRWLVDIARCVAGGEPRYFQARAPRLAELARRTDPGAVALAGRGLAAQRRLIEHPLNARLYCEASLDCYLATFRGPAVAPG